MTKKISEICTLTLGRNIDKKKLSDEGIPYITGASCIQKGLVGFTPLHHGLFKPSASL